jgi:hypothetical protein
MPYVSSSPVMPPDCTTSRQILPRRNGPTGGGPGSQYTLGGKFNKTITEQITSSKGLPQATIAAGGDTGLTAKDFP